jgi:hypothetical protein
VPVNRLSDEIESRYRLMWRLFSTGIPATIAGICLFTVMAQAGVWIGTEDEVGRVLLVATAACAVAARFSKLARTGLIFLLIATFGGRAFGFLIVPPQGYTFSNQIAAAGNWACITGLCLGMVLHLDTLIAFRDQRRRAGIE